VHGIAITLFCCACLVGPATATAGPWEAKTPQGLTVRIVQDTYRTRDAYVLDRVYADGTPDTVFGQQGSTLFTLGPDHEGPAALRLDALGRPWVAGASVGTSGGTSAGQGDTLQAVVLRFLPQGQPDTRYADGGRSATAPGGRRARALDLAPQADGSTYVAGLVQDTQGQERMGWWRLLPSGRVDTGFGLGGLWLEPDPAGGELLELSTRADGTVALSLRRSAAGTGTLLETWELPPGASQPRRRGAAAPTTDAAAEATGAVGSAPAAGGPRASQVANPFGPVPAAASAAPQPARTGGQTSAPAMRWGVVVLVVLASLAALSAVAALWRRRPRARSKR
jgi:hypothetical protein